MSDPSNLLLQSRASLMSDENVAQPTYEREAEGGCGVIGIACSEKIPAKHLLQSLVQMRNRGNGKGGGFAAVGLVAEEFGTTQKILENDYLLAIAYLDPGVRTDLEKRFIVPTFEIDHQGKFDPVPDYRSINGLSVRPPDVHYYFVRVKESVFKEFQTKFKLEKLERYKIQDEIVFQNSFALNQAFYASLGEKKAFVLSHGKNMLILKMVSHADDVVRYYRIEEMRAHVWIGHHRYPTKGRVWHPGGSHPFIGMHDALVHNGDFANYASVSAYLEQRKIKPLFLTDTEVSVLVFDLHSRMYGYPLEYVIESLAPTTERDFTMLPPEKQKIYKMIQEVHMHGSPDGPWFFLIAQSEPQKNLQRLIGITDTSMLRPQVFALQTGEATIGFAASEKQAIDAALESLAREDKRFWSRADRYWNARGGSHTDGGAFQFTIHPDGAKKKLICTDKFGHEISIQSAKRPAYDRTKSTPPAKPFAVKLTDTADELAAKIIEKMPSWGYGEVLGILSELETSANEDCNRGRAIQVLTTLMDRRHPAGNLRRSSLISLYDESLARIVESIKKNPTTAYGFRDQSKPSQKPASPDQTLVIDARPYQPEGPDSLSNDLVKMYKLGFRRFMVVHAHGHRFIGNGFGIDSKGVRMDVYGSSGDYLASGIDGMEIHVHGNAQDQLSQIMKDGKLVIHGDVGQTFMYAAKGGQAYVLGNAAGRPLINAVGKPRVVINGTCLDYLAESFMAGDPLNGGGFVILNGIRFDDDANIMELDTPYPGGNLFSLASGGAIYARDPYGRLTSDHLNGGEFTELTDADWNLIKPYLDENERLFGVPVTRLLQVAGKTVSPRDIYRKVRPGKVRALQAEEIWVHKKN
ncbi:glutamate synthase [Candidatus Acetothermia bacterium]|nr:glutamate synthase [Candidatus Acetothermia bacterium]MBI3642687.1 glutamate synthase [Candidatus Acetothermia bacterium]